MNFKICTLCGDEFPATLDFFYKKKGNKYGLHSRCKKCCNKKNRDNYVENREYYLEKMREYKKSEKGKKAASRYGQSEKGRVQQKKWRESEKGMMVNKRYRQTEKGKKSHRECNKKYYTTEIGKESARKSRKKYLSTEHGIKVVNEVHNRWYKNNRLSNCMSRRINASLYDNKNGNHWEKLVDFDLIHLKTHIESLFHLGMSWDNYGKFGWHIDHKIPISSFNITDYECEDFKKCWSLKNLQPMWWRDNLRKGSKVNYNE